MPKIVNFGNALTDVLTQISSDEVLLSLNLPKGSMTLISEDRYRTLYEEMQRLPLKVATGGSAANTALCLAHLGSCSHYIGKLNTADRFGEFFARTFDEAGVNTSLIPATGGKSSGVCTAFVSADGERTFATYLGAAADMQAHELTPAMFHQAAIVHIEGYLISNPDLILRAIELAHEAGALVSLDMASYNIVEAEHATFERILPLIDIVFANEEEAAAWKSGTPEESLASLASICRLAVVKVGAKGAWARRGEECVFGPAERIAHVVDTTAAGDFFAAGFLHALSQSRPLDECLHAGAYCSSRVIQVLGTQLTPDMWEDLRSHLA